MTNVGVLYLITRLVHGVTLQRKKWQLQWRLVTS